VGTGDHVHRWVAVQGLVGSLPETNIVGKVKSLRGQYGSKGGGGHGRKGVGRGRRVKVRIGEGKQEGRLGRGHKQRRDVSKEAAFPFFKDGGGKVKGRSGLTLKEFGDRLAKKDGHGGKR